jgi:hypothetical protein
VSLTRDVAASIFEQAVRSPYGLVLKTYVDSSVAAVISPAQRAKQILYRFRQELPDPAYARLQIKFDPRDPVSGLWIINTEGEALAPPTLEEPSYD